ncbi:MAG: ABC transporter substrate-binding protein [Chloroflexota bacterium]|nr:ABC transporter substrate-binding protein [Chloroflexota bacterium]MDE2910871.1 ABC transporter substrate-binding protein [Chloroflexota bacterium]
MFRGCRWQLIALLIALVLFIAGAVFRINRQTNQLQRAAPTQTFVAAPAASPVATQAPPPAEDDTDAAEPAAGVSRAPAAPYREGIVGSVQRLNPLFAHLNPVDRDISSLIFEGLFATNQYGEVVPRLAEQLVISSDGIEYVVRLRQDARWHDGRPFGADDVAYTMSLLSDPAYASISPFGEFFATVETQKLNDHLLRFRLAQPQSSFPYLLTIGILPEHALRGTTMSQLAQHPFNLSPIGTGPYQLAGLRLGARKAVSAVDLARAPVYLERPESPGRYALARLSFHLYPDSESALAAYASGAVNALANVAPRGRLLDLPNGQVYTQAAPAITMLIYNWNDARVAERRVRQALALSLDLPKLVHKHFGADVTYADSPYTPGSSIYLPHAFWHSQDLEQARALLSATGIFPASASEEDAAADADDNGDTETLLSLLIEDAPALRNFADEVANHWGQLGFAAQIDSANADDLANRLSTGRFQTAIIALPAASDFDLYRFWHPAQHGSGRNYGAAADPEIAELIEGARREIYPDRRATLLLGLQAAFAESAIAIPLYYPLYTFVVSDQIEGIQLNYLASGSDRFRGIGEWRSAASPS